MTDWTPWRFLIGSWTGEGGGAPGMAEAGGCTFGIELNGHVLVRRDWLRLPATEDRAAVTHEDVMYFYPERSGWGAVYFDSEGHVTRYRGTSDGRHAALESAPDADGVRYRLRYEARDEKVALWFEIAAGQQDFVPHVSGTLERAR